VKDAKTGEPLPGANVIISGTNLGAATDIQGQFTILYVPPGIYKVEAHMIGYRAEARTGVKVDVDRTVIVSFELEQTAIEMGEIVVQAKRDLVQLDVSGTENYITKEEYNATPFANRIEDIIGLQSGVTGNLVEGDIKIREGNFYEVGVLVDGFSTVDAKFNRPIFNISPGVVQEIKIMRNGFNAEYGTSRSGIINIVTKDPDNTFHGTVDYQLTPARRRHEGPNIYDPQVRWEYRLYDGPNAMTGDTLVLFEGKHEIVKEWRGWNKRAEELNTDANPNNDLTPEEARELWRWRHRPIKYGNTPGHNVDATLTGPLKLLPWKSNFLLGLRYENRPFTFPQSRKAFDDRSGSLKITNQLGANTKFTLSTLYSEVRTVPTDFSNTQWSNEDRISYDGGSNEIFYPYRKPIIDRYSTLVGGKLIHTFSPTRFLEFNSSYFYTKWHLGTPNESPPDKGRTFGNRLFLDPHAGWIPKDKGVDDLASSFRMYGGAQTWDNSYSRRFDFKATLTDQFHRNHELKAGLQFTYDVLHEDRLHWHNDDPAQAFTWKYHVKPFQLSAFVQDKIEFKGMIANIGVRWDYYNPNSDRPDVKRTLEQPSDKAIYEAMLNGTYPTIREKAKQYFSPRVGVSFPLTESSKLYFNYGHFVQMPPNEALYASTLDAGRPRVQWMGNIHLTYEKTIAYELGYDQSFKGQYQLHIGAFYKDYHDAVNGMVYAHSTQSLILEWPDQRGYQEIRGIEIELRKPIGRFITGFINYNITRKSQADLTVPRFDSCCPIVTDDPNVGVNGELSGVPRPDIADIAPYGRGVITLHGPRDWGPKLGSFYLLARTQASLEVFYQGPQRVEHPDQQFRIENPGVVFKTIPFFSSNLRITRKFDFGQMGMEVYFDVSNFWVSKYRNLPSYTPARIDYFNDLFEHGKENRVGSEDVSDPLLLRTESKTIYRGKLRQYVLGVRYRF
ncbi:MAG: hypothetical protein D6814_06915, partial [Calditrichaeota bacterium]